MNMKTLLPGGRAASRTIAPDCAAIWPPHLKASVDGNGG